MRPLTRLARPLACAGALASAVVTARADAAGLYFSDRGVRPLGRGGAFVAGADDLGAIYYNPAGVADAGGQVLLDASWLHFTSDYTRRAQVAQVDPNTGQPTGTTWTRTFDPVHGTSPVLPIPTFAVSHDFGLERWSFAAGAFAPYSAITSYPETLGSQPAPQRYSLITLDGSLLSVVGAWAAYRPSRQLALGAGVGALVGTFSSSVAFTACVPERFVCATEQPDWDANSRLSVGPIVSPTGNLGAIWSPSETWRVGASFQLPVWVDAPAKVSVRLPTASLFANASQDGQSGHVKFRLPWIARTGVEWRGAEQTRVELAVVVEGWQMHDRIDLVPDDIILRNVSGFPSAYKVGAISIPRDFQNAWSLRLGGEKGILLGRYRIDLRAGAMYEKSAVPASHLSVLTVDLDKVVGTIGGSLHVGSWRFDAVYAHIFGISADVGTDQAAIPQLNPVRSNPPSSPDYVNAGKYEARADVLGMGLAYQFR